MIAVENLSVCFNRGTPLERRALKKLSLTIAEGEFCSVIGSNGAGKIDAALGASPATCLPETGRIVLSGRDVTRLPAESARRPGRARVPGSARRQLRGSSSIAENLALAARRGARRGFGDALGTAAAARRSTERVAELGIGLEKPARPADGLALRRPAAGAGAGHGDARALRRRAARRAHRRARSGQRGIRAAAHRRRSPAASA